MFAEESALAEFVDGQLIKYGLPGQKSPKPTASLGRITPACALPFRFYPQMALSPEKLYLKSYILINIYIYLITIRYAIGTSNHLHVYHNEKRNWPKIAQNVTPNRLGLYGYTHRCILGTKIDLTPLLYYLPWGRVCWYSSLLLLSLFYLPLFSDPSSNVPVGD